MLPLLGRLVTVNILNPAAVKLGGRIEYLGFLAGRLESTETKSLHSRISTRLSRGLSESFFFHLVGIAREGDWLTKLNRLAYFAGH